MLSSKSLFLYFSKLPCDFSISIGNSKISCNRQSISCFSNVIKNAIKLNPEIIEFKLPNQFNPDALKWIVSYLNYQSLKFEEFLVFDIYLIASILEIKILKKDYEEAFFSSLNDNNFMDAFNILQTKPDFWDPVITFIKVNPNIYFDLFNSFCLPHEFVYEIMTKTQIFIQIKEDDKLIHINKYYEKNPQIENQNNSINLSQESKNKFLLYKCLDINKLSTNSILSICNSNNVVEISKTIYTFPFIRKLLKDLQKLQSQIQSLHETHLQKNMKKEQLIQSMKSPQAIEDLLNKEMEKFEDHKNKFWSLVDDYEYLTSCIEMLFIPKIQVETIINSIEQQKILQDLLFQHGRQMGSKELINISKSMNITSEEIIGYWKPFLSNIDDCNACVGYFNSCVQTLTLFVNKF